MTYRPSPEDVAAIQAQVDRDPGLWTEFMGLIGVTRPAKLTAGQLGNAEALSRHERFGRLAGSALVWDAAYVLRTAPLLDADGAGRSAYAEGVLTGAVRVFAAAHALDEADIYLWLEGR